MTEIPPNTTIRQEYVKCGNHDYQLTTIANNIFLDVQPTSYFHSLAPQYAVFLMAYALKKVLKFFFIIFAVLTGATLRSDHLSFR